MNLKPLLFIDKEDHIVDTTTPMAGPSTTVHSAAPPSVVTTSIYRPNIKGGTNSIMANPVPLPTYTGETGVKQDEFIDSRVADVRNRFKFAAPFRASAARQFTL